MKEDVNTLAGYFTDVPDVYVARIDVSKNDVNNVELREFPMFMFFPAGEDHPSPKRLEKHPDLGVGLAARSEL